MARIPFAEIPKDLLSCMRKTEQYVKSLNIVDHAFMEILRYKVSTINKCAYCIEMHFKEAVAAGESELRVYSSSAWRDTTFYNDTEQALLSWAESVTTLNDSSEQRQQSFNALRKHISQDDIANITLAIVQINAWNRLAKSFDFEAGHYQVGQH